MVTALDVVTVLEVSLLRSIAFGQDVSRETFRSRSPGMDDGATFGVALPLGDIVLEPVTPRGVG
jgi:hypothetical protein